MTHWDDEHITRRAFLRLGLLLPPSLAVMGCVAPEVGGLVRGASTSGQDVALTPSCDEDPRATPPQTAGPFYTPSSPERRSLVEAGLSGQVMLLSGQVLSRQCEPISYALLDFWQADAAGAYDNRGYRLRGHQYADEAGRYELETIVPGLYPGRTRHIHVRVQAPGGPILTTQLYFPREPGNARDGLFNPALLMAVEDEGERRVAAFTFVVETA